MPWKFVAVASAVIAASGNLTLTEPAGVQENDLLVACISYRSNAAFTKPTGWIDITSQNTGDVTAAATTSIASGFMAYVVRGTSAPALTFTRTVGDVANGRIVAYREVDKNGVLVTSSSTTLAAAATAVSVTGVTTVNSNDLIVAAACGARNVTFTNFDAVTNPTTTSGTGSNSTVNPSAGTWRERADSGTTTGADCSLAIGDAIRATAGATGNITLTASASARHVVLVAVFKQGDVFAVTPTGIATDAPTLDSPTVGLYFSLAPVGIVTGTPTLDSPTLGREIKTPTENYSIVLEVTVT